MSQEEMVTGRLTDIIQRIQGGRQTGTLVVKRDEGIYEEGTIAFVKGQITQAKVGRRNGIEALNWLSTWRICTCLFVPSSGEDTSRHDLTPSDGLSAYEYPRQAGSPVERHAGPVAMSRSDHRESTTPLPATSAVPYAIRQLDDALRLIESNRLSRTHRHMFLLVDGQRSIAEISRVTRRGESEALQLLQDLERVAVIKLS